MVSETGSELDFCYDGLCSEAASSLQIRSCKPEHQRAALSTLEMFACHFLPPDLKIPLLPGVPAGPNQFARTGHEM